MDFAYIWAMLAIVGLGGCSITLVEDLILGGSIKIYINGLFLDKIKLDWGTSRLPLGFDNFFSHHTTSSFLCSSGTDPREDGRHLHLGNSLLM